MNDALRKELIEMIEAFRAGIVNETLELVGYRPIETAPQDGSLQTVYVAAAAGLPAFVTRCAWHPDAGYTADELRPVTHWLPDRGREAFQDICDWLSDWEYCDADDGAKKSMLEAFVIAERELKR